MLPKTKQLTIRADIELLNKIKSHYSQQGIKLCRFKIDGVIFVNLPLE